MDKLIIEGGHSLNGSLKASGAKNSALPILASSLLLEGKLTLSNIPHLKDVTTMIEVLGSMGANITLDEDMNLEIDTSNLKNQIARYELVKTMRASVLVLGPLLAKFGQAEVALPGGCAIGSRPVNLHLDCMKKLGAEVITEGGYIKAKAENGLKGAQILFDTISVTGTENAIMAAVLADGETLIKNAAREPEVGDLIDCLISMGAKIQGRGTKELRVFGVKELKQTSYEVMPDRIETATYLTAVAMTGGEVSIKNTMPKTLDSVLKKLIEAGAKVDIKKDTINLKMDTNLFNHIKFFWQNFIDKKKTIILIIISLFGSFLELVSLGAAIPLILVIVENDISNYPIVNNFFLFFEANSSEQRIFLIIILFLLGFFIRSIFLIYVNIFRLNYSYKLNINLSKKIHENILNQSILYFTKNKTSTLIQHNYSEVGLLSGNLVTSVIQIIIDLSFLLMAIFFFLQIEPTGTFIIGSTFVLLGIIYIFHSEQ